MIARKGGSSGDIVERAALPPEGMGATGSADFSAIDDRKRSSSR
jgi:hypothetical protein